MRIASIMPCPASLIISSIEQVCMSVINGTGGNWRCGIGSVTGVVTLLWPVLAADTAYTNKTALFRWNVGEDTLWCAENSARMTVECFLIMFLSLRLRHASEVSFIHQRMQHHLLMRGMPQRAGLR